MFHTDFQCISPMFQQLMDIEYGPNIENSLAVTSMLLLDGHCQAPFRGKSWLPVNQAKTSPGSVA